MARNRIGFLLFSSETGICAVSSRTAFSNKILSSFVIILFPLQKLVDFFPKKFMSHADTVTAFRFEIKRGPSLFSEKNRWLAGYIRIIFRMKNEHLLTEH